MILFGNYMGKRSEEAALEYEIIGIISKLKYDPKQIPTIYVNGEQFYLAEFGIRKRHELRKGDSIFKEKNGQILKHYKKYSNGFYLKESYYIN